MLIRVTTIIATFWAAVPGGVLSSIVQSALPHSDGHVFVEALYAAPCGNRTVWMFWGQGADPRSATPTERSTAAGETGTFVSLLDETGHVLLAPRRILGGYEAWEDDPVPIPVSSYVPVVCRDGRVLVFVHGSKRNALSVIALDQKGNIGRCVLDVDLHASWPSMYHDRPSARVWSYEEENGGIVVIFGENRDVVRAELSVKGTKIEVEALQRYKFWSDKTYRRLWWSGFGWDYSDIQPLDSNLLVVVHMEPDWQHPEDVVWGQPFPNDTMLVYWLRSKDLSLVDSVRLNATSVAGEDYSGAHVPRAVLQKLSDGFRFYVPRSYGTASFRLDLKGRPVLGERAKGAAQTDSVFDGTGPQLVSFSLPGWLYHLPEKVTWFGFTRSGVFCQDSSSRPWSEKSGLR